MDQFNIARFLVSILLIFDGSHPVSGDTDSGLFAKDNQEFPAKAPKNQREAPVGFLSLPPNYNRLAIPLGNVSEAIFVKVYLSIREVLNVDTENEIIEVDTEMGLTWFDWQIWEHYIDDPEALEKAKKGPEFVILDSEFLKQIWKPDIYIDEMANVERTSILSKLITLKFIVAGVIPGAISFRARQTLKLRCDMKFKYYPADIQDCQYNIRSYSYTEDKLFLIWDPLDGVYLDQLEDPNYDFQISDVEPFETLENLFITTQVFDIDGDQRTVDANYAQNYSALSFTLRIRRNIRYHLIQTYMSSVLLIFITWLCFLLPQDLVEVRIGISMTTLLTMTALFSSVRERSPDVSYIMAIDTWMICCICFIFTALVLFTVMHWMRRRSVKKTSSSDNNASSDGINADLKQTPGRRSKQERRLLRSSRRSKYMFIGFVFVFLLFMAVYATWLGIASEYYDWEPSPLFNAIEEDAKLFQRQEEKFKPENTNKVLAAAKREYQITQERVLPRLYWAKQKRLNKTGII